MRIACRKTKARTHKHKHTLRICNTYCFSTTTMVTRTHLSVKEYAHCLSFSLPCVNTGRWLVASSLMQRSELIHTNILHTSKRHTAQSEEAEKSLRIRQYWLCAKQVELLDFWNNNDGAWIQSSAVVSLRQVFFWDFTRRRLVNSHRRFGKPCGSDLQGQIVQETERKFPQWWTFLRSTSIVKEMCSGY